MTDDFRVPPAQRKEPQRFEPPPWEKEAFERLAAEAGQKTDEPPEEQPSSKDVPSGEPPAAGTDYEPPVSAASQGPKQETRDGQVGELDERQTLLLLSQLKAEEPQANESYWRVSVAVGAVIGTLGAVLVVWAMAAYVAPGGGAVGSFGGTVLMLFGVGFIGGGAWFIYKGLRQRGVL